MPVLDKRKEIDVYNFIMKLAKSYVPQWNVETQEADVGAVLTHIFAKMYTDTLKRYNKIPYKNLIYFMNLIGGDILPCISSKGYVTVKLNEGTPNGVPVKKGARVYGQYDNDERVVFEINDDFLAVDNKINQIYCKSPSLKRIVKNYDANEGGIIRLFDFFAGENLQTHSIYFNSQYLLLPDKNSKLYITVVNAVNPYMNEKVAAMLSNTEFATWKYLDENGWQIMGEASPAGARLEFINPPAVPLQEFMGQFGYWLCCDIVENVTEQRLGLTGFSISSSAFDVLPEGLYNNDLPLTKTDFMPFGEKFSIYDDFYINCTDVFQKKGSVITLDFTMDSVFISSDSVENENKIKWKALIHEREFYEPDKNDIMVERVIWEYWNTNGWVRLFDDNRYEDIFRVKEPCCKALTFICPEDIEINFVGAEFGYFIRARIVTVNNAFMINSQYCAPMVKKLALSYSYNDTLKNADYILHLKDMKLSQFDFDRPQELLLWSNTIEEYPAAYLMIENPIKGGPIKIYFSVKEISVVDRPSLKWEYWGLSNGTQRWISLKVADETKFLNRSGIVTLIVKDDFQKGEFFGKQGYWIRLVNMDRKYDDITASNLPILKAIHFNTVKIEQRETMNTEYFYIEQGERDRLCQLNYSNILNEDVWVNEADSLIGDERYNINYTNNTDIDTDSQGYITHYWVKWKRIKSFSASNGTDRVYILDEVNGTILFGDGINGRIPNAMDTESIRVNYTICVGERGNFDAYKIEGFVDAVPFVDNITNVEPINGGCNSEMVEAAIKRSFLLIKHQNRVVSEEDYGVISMEADRNIIAVKTNVLNNCIQIAVLPKKINLGEQYFSEIRNNIKKAFDEKAPAVITYNNAIQIFEVKYIEYSISIHAFVKSYNDYQDSYKELEGRLEKYLNPITGNFDSKGFEIGVLPNKMKIYNYLKNIKTIAKIETINIYCHEITNGIKKEIDYDNIFNLPFAVPINGAHDIVIDIIY